ncbi:DUF2163 domain-containing protein [Jiella sonneratiae]|uniref:DUF2163 domain-containing protein n=1 Tax=Jiella sonneratiae TaxID=2816856 RepID=A0ABS3J5G8_9HYPH|nr:DUF2163 domain-containing protein [Jiella sonneratiae]MBO0904926.1 DUF2163 domain-containing protein [Jiella sonneratiae]
MRTLPDELAAAVAGPVTTLANCWRLTRKDGSVLGFTDHDEPLVFAGTRFEAATGLSASEAEAALGLGATTGEVEGALSSAAIREEDVAAGRFDGATVESFVVDWRNPAAHVRIDVSDLGEVRRDETAFTAELRSVAARLEAVRGRIYRRRCDAVFGDARCGFDLSQPPYTVECLVAAVGDGWIDTATALGAPPESYAFGRLTMLTGEAAGLGSDVVSATDRANGTVRIAIASPIVAEIAAGDGFRIVQGCDKRFATCRGRFANQTNFRGFPHIPGSDASLAVGRRGNANDGSPVVP